MNRLQNLVLLVWTVALLLFVGFNWQIVWRPMEISYLFMDFTPRVMLWLLLAAFVMPIVMRFLGAAGARSHRKRADREINVIKAKAFDGLPSEFNNLVTQLQEHLDTRIRSLVSDEPESKPKKPPKADPPAAAASAASGGKDAAASPAVPDSSDAAPPPATGEQSDDKSKRGRKGAG